MATTVTQATKIRSRAIATRAGRRFGFPREDARTRMPSFPSFSERLGMIPTSLLHTKPQTGGSFCVLYAESLSSLAAHTEQGFCTYRGK